MSLVWWTRTGPCSLLTMLSVEPHDSLVQQLMVECWKRLERFSVSTLSKFSICLNKQFLNNSPLVGQIAEIVSQKLDSIDNLRILTTLMTNISHLMSPRLCDALLERASILLDTIEPYSYNSPRRIVQFLRNIKYTHHPLLEKCKLIILKNMPYMDVETISMIMGLYHTVQYSSCELSLAARQRLMELMDSCTDPVSFTKLINTLYTLGDQRTRRELESAVLSMADQLSPQQALNIAEALIINLCQNLQVNNKIASVLQRNLEVYRPLETAKMTQVLIFGHFQKPEVFAMLRSKLLQYLQGSVYPYEVTMLIRALSMLPSPFMEEVAISRIDAVLPQCSLHDLSLITLAITKWIRTDSTYCPDTPNKYVHVLQSVNHYGSERLRKAGQLDQMLEELKYISKEWFEKILLKDTIAMIQRLEDQVSWTNVSDLALFLTRVKCISTPLLDRIASVALENIHKMNYPWACDVLHCFAVLNYSTPKVDELFEASIQHLTSHMSSIDPHLLVCLAYTLAMVNRFPEAIIRKIFSVDFLAKLDTHLEVLTEILNMRVRVCLMMLNRAVCLECPEFQVPWFHERFCRQFWERNTDFSVSPLQKQIHNILVEVLGGIDYVRVAVLTPYFYTVDFECVLDSHNQPVPYSELQLTENGMVHWDSGSAKQGRKELPPGSRRIAIHFLHFKAYCINSQHVKGKILLKKRHLEILGYHVLQIPHFEWNSMELSTKDAWKEYLRKKLFTEHA
ncbi:FAST kinase domain-containing protein 1, mitochondrial isoform X2 [Salminus brasiliensis]|uniref:FAST kinase domain-containing protein 1, mitochondrial isoform X2 n=1 Tax=Salminus brasiliensis TaxID=930266 RepID=UPI003B830E0D